MRSALAPVVLLALAVLAAAMPAAPLDLLLCRCTGRVSVGSVAADCCGPRTPGVRSCCSREAPPGAPLAGARGPGSRGCMVALQVRGTDDPAAAARPSADAAPADASHASPLPSPIPPASAAIPSRGVALPDRTGSPAVHLRI